MRVLDRLLVVLVLVLVASACGDAGPEDATSPTSPDSTTTSTTASDDSGCPDEPFTGEVSRSAADGHEEVARVGTDMIDSLAVARLPEVAYTIYLADHEIDREELGSTLVAPPGGVLITFAIDEEDGIVVGVRTHDDESGRTPFVVFDSGGGPTDSSQGHRDHHRIVTGLSEARICFEIEYHDDVKSVVGTVSAPVELSF